jgi:zinc transport system substrate-binding protein
MKKTIGLNSLLLMLFLLGISFSGCSSDQQTVATPNGTDHIKVAATIFPLYDIVKNIGGDKIDAVLILPPGASPHTYEASPKQVKEMQNTDILFSIGAGVDTWAQDIANVIAIQHNISLDQYVPLIPFQPPLNSRDTALVSNDEEGDLDPHYWLSPDNARIMASQIATTLISIDPENATYYELQKKLFNDSILRKDAEWKNTLAQLDSKELVVLHDAWGYFANHFDLTIVATFEPFPGKSPSPHYLIDVQNEISKHPNTALFVEPQLSQEAITTLANDLHISVHTLDPLGGVEGRMSYLELIEYNIHSVFTALK